MVAVTKADAVEPETLELALAEARELVPGSEVVAVSAKTGLGLGRRYAPLWRAPPSKASASEAPTRLYVDRVFSLHGIGTVATGTLWSGRIASGDVLRVDAGGRAKCASAASRSTIAEVDRPPSRAARRRRTSRAWSGPSCGRGDALVEPGAYDVSYRLDVEVEELAPIPARVLVHHGTTTMLARVVRVGRFAQLRLDAPVVAARGDRVVLRAGTTVGGGLVIDAAPPRHADAERFERSARGESSSTHRSGTRAGGWTLLRRMARRASQRATSGVWTQPTRSIRACRLRRSRGRRQSIPRLGLERRGAKLYRPGAAGARSARGSGSRSSSRPASGSSR